MRPRALLDTNFFVYAYERPASNSRRIVDLLNRGRLEGVVTDRVVREVMRFFRRHHGKDVASRFRDYLFAVCRVVWAFEIAPEMKQLRGQVKEKDLEQIAAVRALGLWYLVSYDKDFQAFPEYVTPREFLRLLGAEVGDREY